MRPQLTLALILALTAACSERPLVDVEPVTTSYVRFEVRIPKPITVDLLLVIDNTPSMAEERSTLQAEIPRILYELLDPPRTPEGHWYHLPVQDIHVGVVSTDMGCTPDEHGDNGILLGDEPGGYLAYESRWPDPAAAEEMAADIERLIQLDASDCGIEQPLEAALAALTVHTQPGGRNEGFLRDDSILQIVFITDEDDCSVRDPAFFDRARSSPMLACTMHPESLQPLDRYIEGFTGLRDPDRFLLSLIAGVPFGPVCEGYGEDIPDCGDHPDMAFRLDAGEPGASCISSTGQAYPPSRLVELAQQFGSSALVQTICQDSYSPAFEATTYLPWHCWGWDRVMIPYRKDPDDPCRCTSPCTIIERIEGESTCPGGKIRSDHGSGNEVLCTIPQAGIRLEDCEASCLDREAGRIRDGEGWAYGTGAHPCHPWDFSESLEPEADSTVYLECRVTMCPDNRACGPVEDPGSICCPPGYYCEEGYCYRNPE